MCTVPPDDSHGLDLNEAWSDKYASDKITLHFQRFYLSVILGVASFGKHVARLRSWKEARRTSAFFVVRTAFFLLLPIFCLPTKAYFTAWSFDLLVPLFLGILIIVVSSKEARDVLFPPAPLALVDISTGGLQKPQAGQLGTTNTLTGAPEKEAGEAAEEEAANFVDNIRHLLGKAIGMHDSSEKEGDPLEGKVPKPIRNVAKTIKAAGAAPGHSSDPNDQTQQPMEEIIWGEANPKQIDLFMKNAPHVLGEFVDNWERFAK